MKIKFKILEDTNQELVSKLKEKGKKKNKEQIREKFIVIDRETNYEDDGVEKLLINKNNGFSGSTPQNVAHTKRDLKSFYCSFCEKKFSKKEHMVSH